MAPPQWAYQVEYFNPSPDEELLCSICRCVFCEPVECPCHHVFCKACITKWLTLHKNCPVCRKRTYKASLHAVVPIITNMIMKLQLKCRNFEHGCDAVMSLEGCESHVKKCEYEKVDCSNGCGESMMRKNIQNHEIEECVFRCIKCNTCDLVISDLPPSSEEHNCINALKKIISEQEKTIAKHLNEIKTLQEKVNELKARNNQQRDFRLSRNSRSSTSSSSSITSSTSSDDANSFFDSDSIIWSSDYLSDNAEQDANEQENSSASSDEVTENDNQSGYNADSILRISDFLSDLNESNCDIFSEPSYAGDENLEFSVVEVNEDNFDDGDKQNSAPNAIDSSCFEISVHASEQNEPNHSTNSSSRSLSGNSDSAKNDDKRSLKRRLNDLHRSDNSCELDDMLSFDLRAQQPSTSSSKSSTSSLPTSSKCKQFQKKNGKQEKHNSLSDSAVAGCSSSSKKNSIIDCLLNQAGSSEEPSTSNAFVNSGKKSSRKQLKARSNKQVKKHVKNKTAGKESSDVRASESNSSSQETESGSRNSKVRRIFERTLTLLEQHNIDSDPDWVPKPPSESDSDSSSSCMSFSDSHSDDSWKSESSYEVQVPVPTYDLLEKYSADNSDDDPDWLPHFD